MKVVTFMSQDRRRRAHPDGHGRRHSSVTIVVAHPAYAALVRPLVAETD